MPKKKFPFAIATFVLILIGVASFTFYQLINRGVKDILLKYGIDNFYYQGLIIIGFVFVILFIIGWSLKKTIKRLIN